MILARFAPVVMETRLDTDGCGRRRAPETPWSEWCLFVPVDVPLLPLDMLRSWAAEILAAEGERAGSYLMWRMGSRSLRFVCCAEIVLGRLRGRWIAVSAKASYFAYRDRCGVWGWISAAAGRCGFAPNAAAEDLDPVVLQPEYAGGTRQSRGKRVSFSLELRDFRRRGRTVLAGLGQLMAEWL